MAADQTEKLRIEWEVCLIVLRTPATFYIGQIIFVSDTQRRFFIFP